VALLRLQAIDRQGQPFDSLVRLLELLGVLLSSGDHPLVAANILLNGVLGQADPKAVVQFLADLWHGPVPCEATVAQPAEDVPAQHPVGHGQLHLGFRSDEGLMLRTSPIGAMAQLTRQMYWPLEGVEATITPGPDDTRLLTLRTSEILDLQGQFAE
jgi:hypothetical protein